jgi:FKBP-type peptidyl-prolyl cis-trans isomerase FkpA
MHKFLFLAFLGVLLMSGSCKKELSEAEQLAEDRKLILADIAAKGLVTKETPEGVHYIITKVGTGANPGLGHRVTVTYKGYFLDGSVFDGTSASNPQVTFPLGGVIEGWQIALPLLQRGGTGTFWIPSGLGYGGNPPPGIPKNAVLIFDIGLIDFI